MVTPTVRVSLTMCPRCLACPTRAPHLLQSPGKRKPAVRRVFQGFLGFWGTPRQLPPWDHTASRELICTEQVWEAKGHMWLKSTRLHPVCPSVGPRVSLEKGSPPCILSVGD